MKQLLFGSVPVLSGLSFQVVFAYVVALAVFVSICGLFILYATSSPYPRMDRLDSEKCYVDPSSGKVEVFPSIHEAPSVELSVVVPAYEEEKRLPKMLESCLEYLETRTKADPDPETKLKFTYEVIVVDDGSGDRTSEVAFTFAKKYGSAKVRVLTLTKNRGKGGAVYMGMMSSRGKYVLFADADGATEFSEIVKLEKAIHKVTVGELQEQQQLSGDQELEISADGVAMPLVDAISIAWEKPALAVGSRAHLEKQSIAKRSYVRTVLMYGFHMVVWLFGGCGNVKDTQCGFKLFTRQAARLCFTNLHVTRWAFDVEVLRIARHFNMKIEEVAVMWTEIEGSKLVPIWSWLQMGKDLMGIWLRYKIGAWRMLPKIE